MTRIFLAISVLFFLLASSIVHTSAQINPRRPPAAHKPMAAVNDLVKKLPASDAVIGIDLERLQKSAIPAAVNGDPALHNFANNLTRDLKENYGIDFTQFDSLAVGIAIKKINDNEYDFDPVAIARGSANIGALIAFALGRSDVSVTTETVQGKTIYLLRQTHEQERPDSSASRSTKPRKKSSFAGLQREFALSALDSETLLIGSPVRVRLALTEPGALDPQLLSYLNKASGTAARFAAKVPRGIAGLLPTESDDLGRNIESIRFIYGGVIDTPSGLQILINGVTASDADALSLKETLEGVQMLGKALLGGSKAADKAFYAKLLGKVAFSSARNEVIFRLELANSDLSTLLAILVK